MLGREEKKISGRICRVVLSASTSFFGKVTNEANHNAAALKSVLIFFGEMVPPGELLTSLKSSGPLKMSMSIKCKYNIVMANGEFIKLSTSTYFKQ